MSFTSGCLGPLLYLLLAGFPILLKLAEAPRFVAWSWWKATSLFWGPWSLLVVLACLGWLVELVQRRRARG
jgi:hypothetical protein